MGGIEHCPQKIENSTVDAHYCHPYFLKSLVLDANKVFSLIHHVVAAGRHVRL